MRSYLTDNLNSTRKMFNCQGRRYNVSAVSSGQRRSRKTEVLPGRDPTPDSGPSLVKLTSWFIRSVAEKNMVPIKFYLDLIPTPDSDLTLQLHGALKSGGYQKGHQTYLSWPTTVATSAARVAPYIFKTTIIARGNNCRAVGGGGMSISAKYQHL